MGRRRAMWVRAERLKGIGGEAPPRGAESDASDRSRRLPTLLALLAPALGALALTPAIMLLWWNTASVAGPLGTRYSVLGTTWAQGCQAQWRVVPSTNRGAGSNYLTGVSAVAS